MHPASFFAPYSPPGGNPMSFHLHAPVQPPPQPNSPVQAPPYRPTRPYPYVPPHHPRPPAGDANALGPVPHPGPPRPHWPPPFSPPGESTAPAYSSSSPPPAYSPHQLKKFDGCRCDSDSPSSDEDDEEGEEKPADRVRHVVMTILVVLNIFVWGLVLWYWIQDDLAGRLWAELQAEGGTTFQI